MATDTSSTTDSSGFELPPIVEALLENRRILVGLSILLPIVAVAILGDIITPYDPTQTHVADRYAGPGGKFLLGTDHLGRDLLSRVILGGRTSLLLGFGATALALVLGVPIGLTAGYAKGRVDEVLMRSMDIIMSVPTLLLGLLILVVLPSNILNVVMAIGVVYAPRIARVTRSATLSVSEEEYVMAAKARGESSPYILFREILPNVTSPIVVEGSVRVGYAIMIGTSLSFLGLGAGPPNPDWGFMISTARDHIYQTPWFLIWPSVALLLTVMSTNLIGDGLRDVLDPRETGDHS
ncbi:ABC transporter permease [Halorubellus sp. JP-L1]|uniref:ABC transporter permease n=1 Tax=Halorubellus sp. JP-L1 TaxID=2715753 RepID=UPI001409367C|nr:ABC transporter permease [Halorubellus sp. JP-L1]NHN42943.1 ABC transporter permease [Halorubellus sp. JP-L1]